ncbi:MAG: hypothetical protein JSU81_06185 [Candidatus Coatesbacteria bacterium]|nr:MAG: hypothetical protein JSU81_06185 [Candidatus Coatesbacteria bacterium]
MKRRAVMIICLLTAAAAWADVGSVISSFRLTGIGTPRAQGIFRDWDYLYAVVYTDGADYLRTYTPAGSLVRSVVLEGAAAASDADYSLLGNGYIDVFDSSSKMLLTYTKEGELVNSKPLPSDTTAFAYHPGGIRYYLARGEHVFRYTLNDVLVNQFYVGGVLGGLASSPAYDGKGGGYVVAGRSGAGGYTYVYRGTGSLVDSFVVPGVGTYGSTVARGYPRSYHRSYWCVQQISGGRWAFQVDINGTAPAVLPASLGKVRALYR